MTRELAAGGRPFELSIREVKQLWWWQRDGAIMTPRIRGQLRRAFGLCPRHTWAHFAAECELRGRPFSTAILYQDLVSWAAQSLRQAPRRRSSPPPVTNPKIHGEHARGSTRRSAAQPGPSGSMRVVRRRVGG
jgi:hypothetical protein